MIRNSRFVTGMLQSVRTLPSVGRFTRLVSDCLSPCNGSKCMPG